MFKDIGIYTGFIANAIKETYAYKFRAMIWIVYDFVFLFIEYFLWRAIFEANGGKMYNVTMQQYIGYIVIGMFVARLTRCNIDFDISTEVKNGNIVMNLLKPYSYLKMNFAKYLGYTVGGAFTLIPVIIAVYFMAGIPNVGLKTWAAFAVSVLFAFIIGFLFSLVIGMLAFWLTNIWGLNLFKWNLIALFSGQMIAVNMFFKFGENGLPNLPVAFLPAEILQTFFRVMGYIAYALPFQAIFYTPSAIYSGMIGGSKAVMIHIMLQMFWVIFMAAVIKIMWNRAQNKLTIMGG